MAIYLISGGTGTIGTSLKESLESEGNEVRVLSRSANKKGFYKWNIRESFIDENALKNVDYIIHLVGAGIADKRWTSKRKKELLESRTKSTQLLIDAVSKMETKPKSVVCASAIGYYGMVTNSHVYSENDHADSGFIGDLVEKWEAYTVQFKSLNIPTSIIRIGVVLIKQGGAVSKMTAPPVMAPLGNGKQWVPWISITDLIAVFEWCLTEQKEGVYNGVASEHINNSELTKALAKGHGKPYVNLGVPAFLLKLMLGEMCQIVLEGSRVSSEKLKTQGFVFKHGTLKKAINDLF
jgi:uncharacterized protein (TIGR01777 family)